MPAICPFPLGKSPQDHERRSRSQARNQPPYERIVPGVLGLNPIAPCDSEQRRQAGEGDGEKCGQDFSICDSAHNSRSV